MRQVDIIPDERMNIVVFETSGKFVIKFESGDLEQSYKFSKDELETLSDVHKILTEKYKKSVYDIFDSMAGVIPRGS
jgi:hypothetical protein